MRKTFVIAVAAAALVGATALPASAADTTATFTLAAGTLSVSAPPSAPAALIVNGAIGVATLATGSLGTVTVSDQRGGATAWSVYGASTPFMNVAQAAGQVTYDAGVAPVAVGGATFTPTAAGVPQPMSTTAAVVGAGTGPGSSIVTFDPTITVAIPPSGNLIGAYSGIITTSIA